MSNDGVTLSNPGDAYHFSVGQAITHYCEPWYRRAGKWILFYVLRRPRPQQVLTKVDRNAGEITWDTVLVHPPKLFGRRRKRGK